MVVVVVVMVAAERVLELELVVLLPLPLQLLLPVASSWALRDSTPPDASLARRPAWWAAARARAG